MPADAVGTDLAELLQREGMLSTALHCQGLALKKILDRKFLEDSVYCFRRLSG
jgi:hypothetical protein